MPNTFSLDLPTEIAGMTSVSNDSTLFQCPKPLVYFRTLHLDLKGCAPTFERLLELLKLIAAAHYNAVLVEWEDMFPWTVDKRFCSSNAYSLEQIKQFYQRAGELDIQIIPLVQTLGHMENVLAVPGYEKLREVEDRCDVLHPLAEDATILIQRMVDDVLDSMPQTPKYFHLGADEAWTFGKHPDSAAYIKKHGKTALFMNHINPLLNHLNSQGIRPLIWHDMLSDLEDSAVEEIAGKADIAGWGYGLAPDETDRHYSLEKLQRLQRLGATLWGGAAYKGPDGLSVNLPDMDTRIDNTLGWLRLSDTLKLKGMIATGWSRNSTHRPQKAPIDAALDLLVLIGHILHDGKLPKNSNYDSITECRKWLADKPEADCFKDCYENMLELGRTVDLVWYYNRALQEQKALQSQRREVDENWAKQYQDRIDQHHREAKAAGEKMRQCFKNLMFQSDIDEYINIRLRPLKNM